MTLLLILITIAYLLLIGSFVVGFDKIKHFYMSDLNPKTRFSIVIPFKNEAVNLPELLKSLAALDYPQNMFEVILIDDDSVDESVQIIKNVSENNTLNFRVIKNDRKTSSPKKDAINKAIYLAQFEWILTTDADCIIPKYWLQTYDAYIQKTQCSFIAGPVSFNKTTKFLERFQTLDILSLVGATIGGFGIGKPFMCNGANLGYKKNLFIELNGFKGNTKIASGDDIFLLEKVVKKYPNQVHYLKSELAIVKTQPQPSIKALLNQRIRWASKTTNYSNLLGIITGLLVLLMNATVICCLLFILFGLIQYKNLLYILVIKISIDFLLIYKSARFFNQEQVLSSFIYSSILYPFFSVFVALISVVGGYKWKGVYYKK